MQRYLEGVGGRVRFHQVQGSKSDSLHCQDCCSLAKPGQDSRDNLVFSKNLWPERE